MNKKIVGIVAMFIAIAAIIGVGIWGIVIYSNRKDIKITNVEITGVTVGEEIVYAVNNVITLPKGTSSVQVNHTIKPISATKKDVKYTVTPSTVASVNDTGLITFLQEKTITLTVEATDGSGVSATVTINFETLQLKFKYSKNFIKKDKIDFIYKEKFLINENFIKKTVIESAKI